MSKGWITLHRDIQDHWVFDDAERFKAWVTVLMVVNHGKKKSLFKGKVLECDRGESLLSHSSWADKFGKKWNRQKVIRFFKLLESESMIEQVNEQVTTRLIVNNYAQYQDIGKSKQTPKQTPDDTVSGQQADTKRTPDDTQLNHLTIKPLNQKEEKHAALADELGVSVELINRIVKHRRDIKKPANTDKKIKLVINNFQKCIDQGYFQTLDQAMDRLDQEPWQTIKPEYLDNKSGNAKGQGMSNLQQRAERFING